MASIELEMLETVSEKRAMIIESSRRMTRSPKSAVSRKELTMIVLPEILRLAVDRRADEHADDVEVAIDGEPERGLRREALR
eukprot:scaffold36738_cov73-Phaeocystis_antarctica.AAC.1